MNKEELKYKIPDYIEGKILDEKVKQEIYILLRTDNEFRKQYEEIRSSVNFLNSAELDSPPEAYFTNLSARINTRLPANAFTGKTGSFFTNLPFWKKYLIPAIPVVIFVFLIFSYNPDDPDFPAETAEQTEHVIEDPVNEFTTKDNSSDEIINNKELIDNKNSSVERSSSFKNELSFSNITGDETYEIEQLQKQDEYTTDELSDSGGLNDYDLILVMDENYSVEDEFENLTPDAQEEILKNLSNTDL
jgi:hypothetical protein